MAIRYTDGKVDRTAEDADGLPGAFPIAPGGWVSCQFAYELADALDRAHAALRRIDENGAYLLQCSNLASIARNALRANGVTP